LERAIQERPEFYVELLTKVYRARTDPPRDEPLTESEQLVAHQAHRFLDRLHVLPGTSEHGEVDCIVFQEWINEVRLRAKDCDRSEIADHVLGQFIARSIKKPDGIWPPTDLAVIMEQIGTEDLFDGFVNGVFNSRGVVTRDPLAGGEPERRLADRFRELSEYARPQSPKLADAFSKLATHYETDARREDVSALRRRLDR
jgi:hypothetical protein